MKNYYIQGSPAKAEEIKAAFERLGYNSKEFDFSCGFFFTHGREVYFCISCYCIDYIIKTHPDYKELELPVKPKFNVGEWLVYKNGNCFAGGFSEVQVVKVKDGVYYFASGTSGSFKFIDENCRLWTIADAKDGDVLATTTIRNCPFIYRKTDIKNNLAYYYAGIDGNGDFSEGCLKRTLFHFGSVDDVVPATKEQHQLLFAKMKEARYEWDADKKELRKTKPHYEIKNFKPFDKVLVRDFKRDKWRCAWFSDYDKTLPCPFITTGADYKQCIPFEVNKHLLGTTNMPSEEFINW